MSTELLIVLGAAGVLAGAALWLRVRRAEKTSIRWTRCPHCEQKVRFQASRAGRTSLCPQCRARWTLPATPEPPPAPQGREVFRIKRR